MKTLKKIVIEAIVTSVIASTLYLSFEKVSNECDYTKKNFINCYEELIDKTKYF